MKKIKIAFAEMKKAIKEMPTEVIKEIFKIIGASIVLFFMFLISLIMSLIPAGVVALVLYILIQMASGAPLW